MTNLIDSEVFLAFSTYATIVILKMMFMGPLTGYFRFTRKVTENTLQTCMSLLLENRVWGILITLAYREHGFTFITTVGWCRFLKAFVAHLNT